MMEHRVRKSCTINIVLARTRLLWIIKGTVDGNENDVGQNGDSN
jgi:hypothetical protein